jgi:hypothetical protein
MLVTRLSVKKKKISIQHVKPRRKTMGKQVTFETFMGIKCPALKAWNQLQFSLSLQEAHGDRVSEQYFALLTKQERVNVMSLSMRVMVKGAEFVKKEVMNFKLEE